MLVKLSESPVAEAHLVASSAMLALIGLLANLPVGNGGTAAPAIRALHNLLVRSEATAALACCLNCVPPLLRLIEHGNLAAAASTAAEAATAAAATLASSYRPGAAPLSEEAVWLLQVAAGEAAAALPPAAVEVVLSATGGGNARPTLLTLPTEAGLPPPPA